MNLPDFSIKRKITVLMIIFIITFFGILAFFRTGLDMMPELEFPVVSIITTYPGVASEEMENIITRPIETVVSSVKGIKRLHSVSQEGISSIIVEFEWGTGLDFAAQDVREKLSWITDYLPKGADSPLVVKFNMSDYPILYYGVTGLTDTLTLRKYLNDNLRPRLERLDGVASVYVMGGLEREITIHVDRDRLSAYGLPLDLLLARLARENINVSGGHIQGGQKEFLVRTMGEFPDVKTISDTIVAVQGRTPIYLRDLARVEDGFKEQRNLSRTNRQASVAIMVMKQSGANTVAVTELVKETIQAMEKQMPGEIRFFPAMDQGRIITQVTSNTKQNALVGAFLAIFMIYLFLRDWRPTLTIAIAIPLSVITTFIGMYFFGYTLNIMTLGGIALGVGMLVDNAVVVIENIFRHLKEGKLDRNEAARVGASEVGMAITASTLTTIAVFLPMTLSSGIAGRLSRPLAVTVTLALVASLFIALTIVPMISSVLFKHANQKKDGPRLFGRFQQAYLNLLRYCLYHRGKTILAVIMAFVASIAAVPYLGREFMPKQDIPLLMMNVHLPVGSRLEETSRHLMNIENILLGMPETEFAVSFAGLATERKIDVAWGSGTADVNEGQIFVRLVDKVDRERSAWEIMEYLREAIPKIPGAKVEFVDMGQMMAGAMGDQSPIAIKIFGRDLETISSLAAEIAGKISEVPGIRDVDTTMKYGKPELRINVDRQKSSQLGISLAQIADTVKVSMLGTVPTRLRVGGEEYDIRVRLQSQDRATVADLLNIKIPTPTGALVGLETLARIEEGEGPIRIQRESQERKVTVLANTHERDMGSIVEEIKLLINNIPRDLGTIIEYGGTYKDMQESFVSLFWALLIAVLLIYMIMAAQFENLVHPMIIMFVVPLAFIGVVIGLFSFNKTISVPSFMGFIILSGVVVNNGIVMIDYINQLRRRGQAGYDALLEGSVTRLRPVLITSLTTVIGTMPMALSTTQGAEMRAPMAVALACGLLFATILTLLIVPVMYSIFNRISPKPTSD
jgi:HAE1 family hydrophobic/amphiphilic exporter-1